MVALVVAVVEVTLVVVGTFLGRCGGGGRGFVVALGLTCRGGGRGVLSAVVVVLWSSGICKIRFGMGTERPRMWSMCDGS